MRARIRRTLSARLAPSSLPTGRARLVDAIELLARVESESRLLRAASTTTRRYRLYGHLALAEDVLSLPALDIDVPPAEKSPIATDARARADVVRLGRADAIARVRAFYVEAGLSVVVHGRLFLPWPRESALHRGAKVCQRLWGRLGNLVLPRILESGRGFRHAWVVEELLPGRVPPAEKWPDLVPRLLEGLTSLWTSGGVEEQPLSRWLSPTAAADALEAVGTSRFGGAELPAIADSARQVLKRNADATLLVGWGHGDPTRLNVLELEDGRLALTDWEAARRRPLAQDAQKTLLGMHDPLGMIEDSATKVQAMATGAAAPWRDQLVVATVMMLARNAIRYRKAERTGNPEFHRVVATSQAGHIQLLARLLKV
jgi:hypothetical protein